MEYTNHPFVSYIINDTDDQEVTESCSIWTDHAKYYITITSFELTSYEYNHSVVTTCDPFY